MSSNKRKAAPLSVSAGLLSSEQAGQVGGAPSSSKRSKVDVNAGGADGDEEDLEGDLDLQEQERKRLQQGRKGRVVTAGYDSDEDSDDSEAEGDDNEEQDGKSNGKVAGVDEDDDMFALSGEDDEGEGGEKSKSSKGKQKGKKFLELGDIEGQEFTAKDAEDEGRDAELELETDEDEVDSEEKEALHDPDAVVQPLKKRRKKPKAGDKEDMGFEMDSFNMKNEMSTGRFDDEGNYIANAKDPHAEHDKWLTGNYSRKGIRAAKEAKEKQEKELRAKEKKQAYADLDEEECKMKLAELMERGESVLEALQRLGRQVKKTGTSGKKKTPETNGQEEVGMTQAKTELEQLTSLSSALMSRFGRINIYDETYEGLLRVVRRSGLVRETWDPAAKREVKRGVVEGRGDGGDANGTQPRQYIYKWSPSYLAATATADASQADNTFGPYPATDLQAWFSSGYFGDQGERILLRDSARSNVDPEDGWKTWEEAF